jgi:uncharacterized cupredoxin-like copper-binding protein
MLIRIVLALALVAALGAVGAAQAATPNVKVTLSEFKVVPKPASVKAGKVVFTAANAGSIDHELVVLKTNIAPGKLKVKGAQAVETGRGGKAADIAPGKSKKLTLTLKKGKYVLLCNVPGHYQAGQRTGFVVK